MKEPYLEMTALIERLHRHFLEVIKAELERAGLHDINNVQSLILYNIGEDELTIGELTNRGYYLGSNVSYNVKKLVENGYLEQERSAHDRRSVRVWLSPKAFDVCALLDKLFARQAEALGSHVVEESDLKAANASLMRLDRFLSNALTYGGAGPNNRLVA